MCKQGERQITLVTSDKLTDSSLHLKAIACQKYKAWSFKSSDVMYRASVIISDSFVILLLGILAIVIKYSGIQPYQRGFYCFDASIRKPYKVLVLKIDTRAFIFPYVAQHNWQRAGSVAECVGASALYRHSGDWSLHLTQPLPQQALSQHIFLSQSLPVRGHGDRAPDQRG